MGKKRANLRDVAKAAGVSVATVSRVLNSPSAVSERTRSKVEEAIERLSFVPSAAARAINSGRTRFVGALVPTLDNAIFSRFLDALERQLRAHQLSLLVATTNSDESTEAEKAKELLQIGAEGFVVVGISHSQAFHEMTERAKLPVVATSFFDPKSALPTIGYDNAKAAQLALKHLEDLGHQKIAVVHGPRQGNDRTQARLAGIEAAAHRVQIDCFETVVSTRGGVDVVERIRQASDLPDAILCLSDVIAMGTLFGLQKNEIRVPEDVSLMGLDDLPGSELLVPALTTVHLPVSRMGALAADALGRWVEQGERPESVLIEARLVPRNSTKQRYEMP